MISIVGIVSRIGIIYCLNEVNPFLAAAYTLNLLSDLTIAIMTYQQQKETIEKLLKQRNEDDK